MSLPPDALKTWSTPPVPERRDAVPCPLCGGRSFEPALDCGGFSYVRCARCALVQQNPRPRPGDIARRYGGGSYLRYELENEEAFLRLALRALGDAGFWEAEHALFARGARRVLDIGCATGALLAALRARGWDAAGVELSAAQARHARLRRGLRVVRASLEDAARGAAFPPASFDVAVASHVIEHAACPSRFARSAARLLRPGGLFFVTTPNIAGFQARLFKERWRSAIFDHIHLFSKRTLRALLESHGFAVEKTVTWGGLAAGLAPPPLKKAADALVKPLGLGDVMLMRARLARPRA